MESRQGDMCRVCRSEGSPDKPLYHPCVCTGSIKYIHQDCLVQWLKYSKKEYCELCKHRYIFTPIYAPDMPKRLPIRDLVVGLLRGILRAVRYWLHYTLVALAWLGIVPLTACRIYRCLFSGSFNSVLTLPLDLLSTENLISDCFQGCFIVTCTLCTFISLVWLREQILHGGGPDWLEHDPPGAAAANQHQNNGAGDGNAENVGGNHQMAPGDDAANQDAAGDRDDEDIVDNDHDEDENDNNGGGQDEANWNPMDWDRAAEELTWERLLGLDGSLLFMEHVFWVVSLNTLFILVFAFCPFHIGQFAVSLTRLHESFAATQFDGVLTTLFGYILIGVSLAVLHTIATLMHFKKPRRILGLCYVAVKVSLLVVGEIGFFPLICGWWLDICSLNMFEATLKDREHSFRVAPGTSMFIHWLVGMVYIFYFASFILLLREVLRPGVLWFLRNLNDPDFNPIQEMIHLPVFRHARRFLASMVVFGTIVLVMLWLPVQCVRRLFPNFLPFHVMLSSSDTPVSELSLELLLLQVVLPALLEQGHTRQWLKTLVRAWCVMAAWLLDLRSYLLGDVPLDETSATGLKGDENEAEAGAEEGDTEDGDEAAKVDEATEVGGQKETQVEGLNDNAAAAAADSSISPSVPTPSCSSHHDNSCHNNAAAAAAAAARSPMATSSDGLKPVNWTLNCHEDTETTNLISVASDLRTAKLGHGDIASGGRMQAEDELSDDSSTADDPPETEEQRLRRLKPDLFLTANDPEVIKCIEKISKRWLEEGQQFDERELTDVVDFGWRLEDARRGRRTPTVLPNRLADLEEPEEADVPAEADVQAEVDVPAAQVIEPIEPLAAEAAVVADDVVAPLGGLIAPLVPQALGDVHQAMMQGGGPIGFQPYKHPNLFALRLLCLLALLCFTLFLASLTSLLIPVYIGRRLMGVWTGETKVHELYTVACGLYACWVVLRMAMILYTWIPQGWRAILNKVLEWTILVTKSVFIAVVLIGVVPLMLGLIFELVIVMPIRVPLEMTPVFFPWQDWALGVLHAKIITAATMMGPQWRLKRVIEQVYQQGLRNMNLMYIMVELCLPVVVCLGLILAVPHIIAKSIVPAFGCDFETQNLVLRRIYPFILGVVLFVTFCIFQARQFRRLYEHIKNDKYLVGQRLVNYDRH